MRGTRHLKIKKYDGVSEIAMEISRTWENHGVKILVYDIIRQGGWREKRRSYSMITIGNGGLTSHMDIWSSASLMVDVDTKRMLYIDSVDGYEF